MTELADRSLVELSDLVGGGEASCRDVVESCLRRIEAVEPKIDAFLSVRADEALAEAAAADGERAAGRARGPLHGLPIAVKDILCSPDLETTCASRILQGFRAPYEATVLRRLREAGLIVIGTTNMD